MGPCMVSTCFNNSVASTEVSDRCLFWQLQCQNGPQCARDVLCTPCKNKLKSCQVQLVRILTQTVASGNRACHDVNTRRGKRVVKLHSFENMKNLGARQCNKLCKALPHLCAPSVCIFVVYLGVPKTREKIQSACHWVLKLCGSCLHSAPECCTSGPIFLD